MYFEVYTFMRWFQASDFPKLCVSCFAWQVDNRIKHSKPGTVETVPERKRKVVKELT